MEPILEFAAAKQLNKPTSALKLLISVALNISVDDLDQEEYIRFKDVKGFLKLVKEDDKSFTMEKLYDKSLRHPPPLVVSEEEYERYKAGQAQLPATSVPVQSEKEESSEDERIAHPNYYETEGEDGSKRTVKSSSKKYRKNRRYNSSDDESSSSSSDDDINDRPTQRRKRNSKRNVKKGKSEEVKDDDIDPSEIAAIAAAPAPDDEVFDDDEFHQPLPQQAHPNYNAIEIIKQRAREYLIPAVARYGKIDVFMQQLGNIVDPSVADVPL
jgi:hypothetical protein